MYLLMFFCFDGSDSKNSLLKRRQRNLTPTLRKVKHCSIFCISSIRNFKAKQTYCYLWFFYLDPKKSASFKCMHPQLSWDLQCNVFENKTIAIKIMFMK